MEKQNVLYFTHFCLSSPSNGASICCLNHVLRLSQDSNINLFVVATGPENQREATAVQLDKFGVKHYFVPLQEAPWKSWTKLKKLLNFGIRFVFRYYIEWEPFNQEHISKYIINLCKKNSIQVVVVDDMSSILFFKDFLKLKQKKVFIAFNRDSEMYLESLKLKRRKDIFKYWYIFRDYVAYLRMRKFERKVHKVVDKFIALGEADVPSYLVKEKKASVIIPYLDPKPVTWNYTESGKVFFVGSGFHFPNYLAVEWLLCELAPKLLKLNSNIKIVIAGTAPHQIPESWQIENAELLGFAPQERIEHLFQTADMFLCPIKNDHGVKIKSVECVSYGTPLYATAATLKGLPYLSDMPVLDLNNPDEAATYICETISKREILEQLSQKILKSASEFAIAEKDRWGKTVLD
jgi:hypothetical protein